jgi:protein involved in polysaccharide export with SLBB domain
MRELIAFAGGFTPDAYLKQSQIRRYEMNRGEIFLDVGLDSLMADASKNLPLVDGDNITIQKNVQVRKNMVSIRLSFVKCGNLTFPSGMCMGERVGGKML